jgi:subtilase family serine protease
MENTNDENIKEQIENVKLNDLNNENTTSGTSPIILNKTFTSFAFMGKDVLSMYNIPSVPPVSGKPAVKIGIIIGHRYSRLNSDLQQYWKSNFPKTAMPKVTYHAMEGALYENNKNLSYQAKKDALGLAYEITMDLQIICTICPNASIHVFQAKDMSNGELNKAIDAANNAGMNVLSMSFGSRESITDTDLLRDTQINDHYFHNTTTCYIASSGDNSYINSPACSPNCLCVGGTSIYRNGSTRKFVENSWSSDINHGAGRGYSQVYPKPHYQSSLTIGQNINSRICPDISALANSLTGIQFYCSVPSKVGGSPNIKYPWVINGGTSLSAPILAGIIALASQKRINVGKAPLTTVYDTNLGNAWYPDPLSFFFNIKPTPSDLPAHHLQTYLYKTILPNPTKYAACIYDVKPPTNNLDDVGYGEGTSGNLTTFITMNGYDINTGIGTPNAAGLISELLNA